jgi:predicted nucleic acid-binding protein
MPAVVLDATPLGLLTHPRNPPHVASCRKWLGDLIAAGHRVILPEIVDVEVRRELIRQNSRNAINNLDQLCNQLEYLPITTLAMRMAANLWAQSRTAGLPTAGGRALDCDVVLAAQAQSLNTSIVVATGNPAHLSRFVPAELWSNISP